MKWLGLTAFLTLTACIGDEEDGAETRGSKTCDTAAFEFLIGQPKEALEGVTVPESLRVLNENDLMTMDHRPDRLNVFHDDTGNIVKVSCG